MKQTRLLEIIREEIAGALNELTVVDKKTSSTEATEIAKSENSDINTVKNAIIQAKKSGEPVNVAEDALNEEPFIDSAFDVTGTSPENLNQDSLQKAIDGAVKVLQQENPDADVKKLAGELQKVNSKKNLGPDSKLSSELKSALQKVNDVIEKQGQIFGSTTDINNLIKLAKDPSQIDRLEKLKEKGYTFILGNPQAITAIEKSLGLKPKNNDSLLTDKSKAEKSFKVKTSTPKNPKEKSEPKAKENKTDAGVDDEGNKVEIDTTIKTPMGDKEIEIKLKDVISKKKDKLKAALKSKDQETYSKEKAALKQFLEKPEITKYIKKKTVDKVNPYTLSSIEDEIK